MATGGGRLGAIEGTTTTWKTLYAPATGVMAVVQVNICNRKASSRTVRVGVVRNAAADTVPGDGEIVLYERVIAAAGDTTFKDQINIGPIPLNGTLNEQIVVYTSGDDVDFQAFGVTET